MKYEQQELMKVIQFLKEHIDKRKMEEAKETAKMLIDKCDGDFSLVFKADDMQYLFNDQMERDYLIATTEITFMDNILEHKRHAYFKLKED